jgi:ATP-dependent Clp protease adaptor protein ClpS
MEFVVHVLMQFFQMSEEKAVQVMLSVHMKGRGVCGQYTKEIAETKAKQVMDLAQENEYPLQCQIEIV